jgi:serine/threonine protein kinase
VRTERPIEMLAERYAFEEELGRGGCGMVWRALDTVLERTVAVKILRPTLAEDPVFAERLAADTSAAARVSAPAFVRLLEIGTDRGVSYLVREHVEGESLRARLDRSGPLGTSEAVRLGAEVLAALAAAHAAGVLHLDVKPENILLGSDGAVRVADLGVGAAIRASRPSDAAELLAPTPQPPELTDPSATPDARTDVYLTGALLFQTLTGRLAAGTRSPRALRDEIPRRVDAAVARSLAPDPAERFADAETFAEALGAPTDEPPAVAREGHGLRAWLLVPVLVALVAALAIALGLWLGRLEIGGPLGVRAAEDRSRSSPPTETPTVVLPIGSVSTFDPFGDGTENDSGVAAAIDGDTSTAWRSENYFDADLRKPGVGLLFDLGSSRTVTGFRLEVPHPGYTFELAIGDDPDVLAANAVSSYTASASMRETIEPTVGRYVLLWITSVVDAGDGDRAEVAEFKVVGPDA